MHLDVFSSSRSRDPERKKRRHKKGKSVRAGILSPKWILWRFYPQGERKEASGMDLNNRSGKKSIVGNATSFPALSPHCSIINFKKVVPCSPFHSSVPTRKSCSLKKVEKKNEKKPFERKKRSGYAEWKEEVVVDSRSGGGVLNGKAILFVLSKTQFCFC